MYENLYFPGEFEFPDLNNQGNGNTKSEHRSF